MALNASGGIPVGGTVTQQGYFHQDIPTLRRPCFDKLSMRMTYFLTLSLSKGELVEG